MGEYVFPFEKLEVWQLAVDLADYVLGLLEALQPNKHIRCVRIDRKLNGLINSLRGTRGWKFIDDSKK
jgi:hypothetical protein